MKKPVYLWASLLAVLLLTSCASRKNFVYLQDMEMGLKYPIETKHEAVVHRDDRLSITVSCKIRSWPFRSIFTMAHSV